MMKSALKHLALILIALLNFFFTCCNSKTEKKDSKESNNAPQNKKSDYELAYEFLHKLKNDKADTIIFYKRTCINCCDYFNIFWSANGQRYLSKFYFDFDDMQTHSKTIVLTNDKIFDILGNNFKELKSTSIKGNTHKNKDGTSTGSGIDHYCYAQMSIYARQDSIITDRIEDHDFDKYTDFGLDLSPKNEKRQTNDNYMENINSKWNLLLTTIEKKIEAMPETISRELETLRTKKSEK